MQPPRAPSAECDSEREKARVAGSWILTWQGQREQCNTSQLNGEFAFRPALELRVDQLADNEAGADRLSLRPIGAPRDSDPFAGSVEGDCIRFALVGEADSSALAWAFSGKAENNRVSGEFRGTGPGDCRSTGTFEVELR